MDKELNFIKMKKPTIYDIKRLTFDSSPYFFNSKTMKVFGQTLKDFKVEKTDDPTKFLIWAKSGCHTTKRIFNSLTNELTH